MSRESQIPGGCFINETATRESQIPGGCFINETITGDIPPIIITITPNWIIKGNDDLHVDGNMLFN